MLYAVIKEQNKRLIDYAKTTIQEIGNQIKEYHSKNGMDRTGNLLDSLCWGVVYNGKLVEGGFYRDRKASKDSFLHEWMDKDLRELYPVNGRMFAEEYINSYGNNGQGTGWKVFFAILAPYWGYWENGFTMKRGGGTMMQGNKFWTIPQSSQFYKFSVMTQFYDRAKADLKPARVRFRHNVVKYTALGLETRRRKDFEGSIKNYYNYGVQNLKPRK